ncbi:MAG TPA: hypothetical protein VKP65_25900 [Rhodothermales bacterium]|nr:hypothetical protein [Rhodothermales bacterium]
MPELLLFGIKARLRRLEVVVLLGARKRLRLDEDQPDDRLLLPEYTL